MNNDTKFNPYDGPTPIFSLFQWSFGGYLGPCLVIYENGLVVRAVYENPEDFFSFPKIMSTVISPDELNLLKEEISTKIDKKAKKKKTEYKESYLEMRSDMPTIDIMCNITKLKHIRIEDSYIKNEKINFFLHGKETDFGNVIDSTVLESLNFDKPDEIPIIMKDCLKFLCEYEFSDLKEYEPFYFKFEIGLKNKEGETVEWPKDFPNLGDYFAYEYSNRFFFYIDGKYYKRVLEFCEKNRHKNIKYRGVAREIYYNPIIIYPHEDLFNYNQ